MNDVDYTRIGMLTLDEIVLVIGVCAAAFAVYAFTSLFVGFSKSRNNKKSRQRRDGDDYNTAKLRDIVKSWFRNKMTPQPFFSDGYTVAQLNQIVKSWSENDPRWGELLQDERAGARKLAENNSVSDSSSSDAPNDINTKTIAEIRAMIGSWESDDPRWNLLEQDSRLGARKLARRRSASSSIKKHAVDPATIERNKKTENTRQKPPRQTNNPTPPPPNIHDNSALIDWFIRYEPKCKKISENLENRVLTHVRARVKSQLEQNAKPWQLQMGISDATVALKYEKRDSERATVTILIQIFSYKLIHVFNTEPVTTYPDDFFIEELEISNSIWHGVERVIKVLDSDKKEVHVLKAIMPTFEHIKEARHFSAQLEARLIELVILRALCMDFVLSQCFEDEAGLYRSLHFEMWTKSLGEEIRELLDSRFEIYKELLRKHTEFAQEMPFPISFAITFCKLSDVNSEQKIKSCAQWIDNILSEYHKIIRGLVSTKSDSNEHYAILGISPGATKEEVHNAWRMNIKAWHPDRFNNDEKMHAFAEEKTKEINGAYAALKSI
jgi:DnaJ-domain-containing protein 1